MCLSQNSLIQRDETTQEVAFAEAETEVGGGAYASESQLVVTNTIWKCVSLGRACRTQRAHKAREFG